MDKQEKTRIAMRVSRVTIAENVLLSLFKLLAGLFAKSYAMISDAVHSASDVLSTVIVMIGVKISGKESDEGHPYGHDRFECVAALILALLLAGTGIGIGWAGAAKIADSSFHSVTVPGLAALIAAVVSIVVKEIMYRYTRRAADSIQSEALRADAWHHRSDALSSVGSLAGIAGARLGLPILDPIASLVICLFILKAALSVFVRAVREMTDEACDEKTQDRMRKFILDLGFVEAVDSLRTRRVGSRITVDLEIALCSRLEYAEAHRLEEQVRSALEEHFPAVKSCTIHSNPVPDCKKIAD